MRILFLTETIPAPLDSGGRIKTFHTLGILSARHEVVCHAFIRTADQRAQAGMLRDRCASLTLHERRRTPLGAARDALRALTARRAFTLVRHDDPEVRRAIRALAARERFDLVYCDHLSMVAYGRGLGVPILYDAHNVEWQLVARHGATLRWPARAVASMEAARVRREEREACVSASLVTAVSEIDAHSLSALAPSARIRVIPIAIDVSRGPSPRRPVADPTVLFVGGLHWPPNARALTWLTADVWPLVRRAVPHAQLVCIGRATAGQRAHLETFAGVTAVGAVDDIEPWFERARVLVVPLLSGSGMRVKILDALARAVPVVTTRLGCEGIDAVPGKHLLVADDPATFGADVVRLLRDDAFAATVAANGRELALERYDLAAVEARILDAVETVAPRHLIRAD
jgi:glycosyltransferase involved in cell wall biosynthesis